MSVSCLKNRSSRCPVLMRLTRRFFAMLDLHSITVEMGYVPSARNKADLPSRFHDRNDWALSRQVFDFVDARWGPFTVDRFASASTALLPRFDAAYRQYGAEAVDAWAEDWSGENNWANPGWQGGKKPMRHLLRLAEMLRQRPDVQATVVCPYWTGQAAFASLHAQASEMIVLQSDGLEYDNASTEVWAPTCNALAFFHFDSGRAAATSPAEGSCASQWLRPMELLS